MKRTIRHARIRNEKSCVPVEEKREAVARTFHRYHARRSCHVRRRNGCAVHHCRTRHRAAGPPNRENRSGGDAARGMRRAVIDRPNGLKRPSFGCLFPRPVFGALDIVPRFPGDDSSAPDPDSRSFQFRDRYDREILLWSRSPDNPSHESENDGDEPSHAANPILFAARTTAMSLPCMRQARRVADRMVSGRMPFPTGSVHRLETDEFRLLYPARCRPRSRQLPVSVQP